MLRIDHRQHENPASPYYLEVPGNVRFLEEAKWRKKSPEFYWPEPIVAAERLLSPVQFCRHW
jgi:hypothetical protein